MSTESPRPVKRPSVYQVFQAQPTWYNIQRAQLPPAGLLLAGFAWSLQAIWQAGWNLEHIIGLFMIGPILIAIAGLWMLIIPPAMNSRYQRLRATLTAEERTWLDEQCRQDVNGRG